MRTVLFKNLLTVVGGLLMAFLFTGEGMGFNTLIFTLCFIGLTFYQNPDISAHKSTLIIGLGTLLASVLVVWHHSVLAQTVYILSFIVYIGAVQQRTLRFLGYGFLLGIGSFLSTPISMIQNMGKSLRGDWKNLFKWAQLLLIPLILGWLFLSVYYQAVPGFEHTLDRLSQWFSHIIFWENPGPAFWMFIWGLILFGSVLWRSILVPLVQKFTPKLDILFPTDLNLQRRKTSWRLFQSMMGLKKEYMIAMLSISILNGLLLLVNISHLSDLIRMQFSSQAHELSQSLHASTELLILSILMAMGVLLLFFRRNLNFYPNNQVLKVLAYTWLAQNALLALMTFYQDLIYIIHYGMAYYRLWLAFFLLLVSIGLVSMYVKIALRKSIFYLLVSNAWSIYLSLLLISCFNWDLVITRFNIFQAKNEQVDLYFLFNLSDKNTFLLEKHRDYIFFEKLLQQEDRAYFEERMKARRIQLANKMEGRSWKSWNYADYRNVIKRE
jgi:hypothetical protein